MNINIVKSQKGFAELKDEWNSLNETHVKGDIFLCWEWQYYWWCQYGKDLSLRILVVRENGKIVTILPLYIKKEYLFRIIPVSILCLVGTGGDTSPDYLGPINSQHNNENILDLLSSTILDIKSEWDCLNITDLGSCEGLAEKLFKRYGENGLRRILTTDACLTYIKLPGSWEEYLSGLSSNRRAQIRRSRRKFEGEPGSRFFIWKDRETLSTAVDKLINLHQMRWAGRSENYAFSSPEYVAFHREVIRELFPKDIIRLCCLELDGRIIAMLYCYTWNRKYYYFQSGFDSGYTHLKPGAVLMSYAIEQAIIEKVEIFDMLKGDYNFKRSLAKHENSTWRFTAYNNSVIAKLIWLRKEVVPKVKRKIRNTFATDNG